MSHKTGGYASDMTDAQWAWIEPQIPVLFNGTDFFANRDPVLDAALQVIRARNH